MKKYLKFAIIMAVAALFAACGYESTYVPIDGTGLLKYDLKTKTDKIVYGAVDSLHHPVIPAAYDEIKPFQNCLIAPYTTADGKKLYNLFKLDGKIAVEGNFSFLEWSNNHFRVSYGEEEFLYYPEFDKSFGPYKHTMVWGNVIFYRTAKHSGLVTEKGAGIVTDGQDVLVIKDKKSGKNYFAVYNGKKAFLYDEDCNPKTVRELSKRKITQLQKKMSEKDTIQSSGGLIQIGSIPNIQAY